MSPFSPDSSAGASSPGSQGLDDPMRAAADRFPSSSRAARMDSSVAFRGAASIVGLRVASPGISLTPPSSPRGPPPDQAPHQRPKSQLDNSISLAPRPDRDRHVGVPITRFHLFSRLRPSVRRRVWRCAVEAIDPRTVAIQPTRTSAPALSRSCWEARALFNDFYRILNSSQLGRMADFTICVNYDKDLLYINRSFVRSSKIHDPTKIVTPFNYAISLYPDWLLPVKRLVLNLTDTRPVLPQVWGDPHSRRANLWVLLRQHCPELTHLGIVVGDGTVDYGVGVEQTELQMRQSSVLQETWRKLQRSLWEAKLRGDVLDVLVIKPMDATKIEPVDKGARQEIDLLPVDVTPAEMEQNTMFPLQSSSSAEAASPPPAPSQSGVLVPGSDEFALTHPVREAVSVPCVRTIAARCDLLRSPLLAETGPSRSESRQASAGLPTPRAFIDGLRAGQSVDGGWGLRRFVYSALVRLEGNIWYGEIGI
ncbi:unnamed protein product [Diplocarpon coronariae]